MNGVYIRVNHESWETDDLDLDYSWNYVSVVDAGNERTRERFLR